MRPEAQAELERLERGQAWCAAHGHTLLVGDSTCFSCGREFTTRELQVLTDARARLRPGDDAMFVAAGERFNTADGPMRAGNPVCRCGHRGAQHRKFWPYACGVGGCGCEKLVELDRAVAAIPRVQSRPKGSLVIGEPKCVCGHPEKSHGGQASGAGCQGRVGSARCGCRRFDLR